MGNDGEVLKTADGRLFKVMGSYEYLYAYSPEAIVCPGLGKMLVGGRTIGVLALQTGPRPKPPASNEGPGMNHGKEATISAPIVVVLRVRACDYFVADGPQGLYVLEWFGGHDPARGERIFGELGGFGFKDVIYGEGQEGRVWVDDYLLGRDSALEKVQEKCR
jgi:hypothetical protein